MRSGQTANRALSSVELSLPVANFGAFESAFRTQDCIRTRHEKIPAHRVPLFFRSEFPSTRKAKLGSARFDDTGAI